MADGIMNDDDNQLEDKSIGQDVSPLTETGIGLIDYSKAQKRPQIFAALAGNDDFIKHLEMIFS